jgi:DNA-binding response OmpR family regulator
MRTLWLRAGAVDLERGVLGEVALGAREIRLLRALAERAGRDVPRDELYAAVWDEPVESSSRALDVAVARLREKVERDPTRPEHLLTVRGVGYRFAPLATEGASPQRGVARVIRLGGVRVDLDRCLAESEGEEILLSAQEAGVLRVLADADGAAVGGDALHRAVWGARLPTGSRAVVRTIGRLRQKLEVDPADPRHLLTARGDGFRLLVDPGDALAALEATARGSADPDSRLGAMLDLAIACRRAGRLTDALGWVSLAIDEAIAHGSPREAQARAIRASMHLAAGDPAAAERDARRAAAIEGPWRPDAELELAIALAGRDQLQEALAFVQSARTSLASAGRADMLLRAESIAGRLLADAGRLDEAAARFESARAQARSVGGLVEAQLTMYLGRLRHLQGDLGLARRESADAERLLRAIASPANVVAASLQQALIDLEEGHPEQALARLLEITPGAANHPGNRVLVRAWTAWARAVVGQRPVAESMLADLPASLPYRGVEETVARIRAAVAGNLLGPPLTVDGRLADRVLGGRGPA